MNKEQALHLMSLCSVYGCLTARGYEYNTRLGMARVLICRCGIVQEDDCEVGIHHYVWLIILSVLLGGERNMKQRITVNLITYFRSPPRSC